MAQAASEVSETEAQGKIKAVYDDIKATLRLPFVAPLFRALATDPDFLQIAWTSLKPNMQTAYFEIRADEIRRFAVKSLVMGDESPPGGGDHETDAVVRVLHYAEPKLFLAVGALRSAANGQQPKLAELSRDQKRQIASGVPEDAAAEVADVDQVEPAAREVLDRIQSTLGSHLASSELRALARWPEYLETAWQTSARLLEKPDVLGARRKLRAMAEEAVVELPYRQDIGPPTMRRAGLSEPRIDAIRATLDAYYRLLNSMVLATAGLATWSLGKESACDSPFPPTIL